MHLSNESLIVIILVGVIAGWLAGNIVSGGGYGLIGDLIVGVIGAFIGDRLLPRLGIHLGTGMVALVVNATLGAIVLLIILRLISGVGGGSSGGVGNSSKARTPGTHALHSCQALPKHLIGGVWAVRPFLSNRLQLLRSSIPGSFGFAI
jgi:uncharacterized membrane protein YeaQ/YmgE (transglycosylase-associated protein family)